MSIRICRTCGNQFDTGLARGRAYYCSPECRCGTVAGYLAGCKCVDCKAARARRAKQDRCIPNTMIPAIGSARRIRALAALGYDWVTLGRELGVSRDQIRQWSVNTTRTTRGTAERIAVAYDRLSMTLPPAETTTQRCTVARARNRAQAEGWAVPLAWDEGTIDDPAASPTAGTRSRRGCDQSVVDRILAGDYRLPATKTERAAVVRRWLADGRSLNELERATGWNARRYRPTDQAA